MKRPDGRRRLSCRLGKLAALYAEEESAAHLNNPRLDRDQALPGKKAIAEAAGMHPGFPLPFPRVSQEANESARLGGGLREGCERGLTITWDCRNLHG